MIVHAFKCSIQEEEEGAALIWAQLSLNSNFQGSQRYTKKPDLKEMNKHCKKKWN